MPPLHTCFISQSHLATASVKGSRYPAQEGFTTLLRYLCVTLHVQQWPHLLYEFIDCEGCLRLGASSLDPSCEHDTQTIAASQASHQCHDRYIKAHKGTCMRKLCPTVKGTQRHVYVQIVPHRFLPRGCRIARASAVRQSGSCIDLEVLKQHSAEFFINEVLR